MIPPYALLLVDVPGRDEARELARRELGDRRYRQAEPPWSMGLA